VRALGRGLLALLSTCVLAGGAYGGVVEYLYVEPNVDGSTGGHAALRFADWVYDFQNGESDTLRLRRTPYEYFRYVYSVIENRTIHVARIETSDDTRDALQGRFNDRYLIQNKHLAVQQALHSDRELLRLLSERQAPITDSPPRGERDGPGFRGAGFFYGAEEEAPLEQSAAMRSLRARIEARHGEAFLARSIRELERAVAELTPPTNRSPPPAVSKDEHPATGYHFSDRYFDLCLKILALRALSDALPLRDDARLVPADGEFSLTRPERRTLRAFAAQLESGLVELVSSKRPDWGFALLLGMARLQAIHESLRSGRLVLLDAFPADSLVISAAEARRGGPFLLELREWAHGDYSASRSHFFETGEPHERDFARLEDSGNRYLEIRRGLSEGRAIRLHAERLIPSRVAGGLDVPLPALDRAAARRAEEAASEREQTHARWMKDVFGYRLVTHNCVSEIFATIDAELGREQSERLGGYVPSSGSLNFVPRLSYRSVVRSYRLAGVGEVPSYRRVRLEAMYAEENDLLVRLRESNTLSSTVYRRNGRDSFFLFFTDDALPLRPLYGALNVAAGAGEMAFGVLRAPLDRGRTLWSGLKGVAFSLPELAFVNLRKGTLDYGPSDPPRTAFRSASAERGGSVRRIGEEDKRSMDLQPNEERALDALCSTIGCAAHREHR